MSKKVKLEDFSVTSFATTVSKRDSKGFKGGDALSLANTCLNCFGSGNTSCETDLPAC